jgi:type III secretory pathway component EscR
MLKGWDKQFLFAALDIPICIIFCFADIAWTCHADSEKAWTWNVFRGMNEWTYSLAGNNVCFGVMMYFIFDWVDSVLVNIIFVLGMTFTWPVELALGFAKFQAVCVVFLVQTTIGCLLYEYLGIKKVEKTNEKNVSV